jgi:hypothetical protein
MYTARYALYLVAQHAILRRKIATAWLYAVNCLWQLTAPEIASGNFRAWF